MDKLAVAVAKKYTDETVVGGGAIKGKNCTIESIEDVAGGHKINFKWTLDDGTELTDSMDVMNGQDGQDGQDGAPGQDGKDGKDGVDGQDGAPGPKGEDGAPGKDGDPGLGIKSVSIDANNHLIVTYDDDTTQDAGEIPGAGGTGDYEQLDNLPSIAGVQLIGNITLAQLGIDIPTSTSELTNDSGFINNAVNDLVNYYKKSETYTKEEVQQLIQAIPQMHIAIVQQLPTEDISTSTIYFVPKQTPDTNDVYDEYMYISNAWEHIGSTAIDLSNYYTKTQVDTLLAAKANATDVYTKSQVDTAISEVEDTVDSLSTAQSELAGDVETLGSEVVALAEKVNSPKEHTGTYLAEVGTKEGSALAKRIYGMSVQDGTPTPSVPVEIESAKANFRCVGKNLIKYPFFHVNGHTNKGLTFNYDESEEVTVNGTVIENQPFFILLDRSNKFIIKANIEYTLSLEGNDRLFAVVYFYNPDGSLRTLTVTERYDDASTPLTKNQTYASLLMSNIVHQKITFSVNDDTIIDVQLRGLNVGETYTNAKAKVNFSLSNNTDFVKYQGQDITTDITLRAIEVTSRDDYNLERDGKYYIADTIDWSEDKGYVITRRVESLVFDGSENWGTTADWTSEFGQNYGISTANLKLKNSHYNIVKNGNDKLILSDTMIGAVIFYTPTIREDKGNGIYRTENYLYIQLNTTTKTTLGITSLESFKTWMANNNVEIIVRVPAYTEPITSEQAQALLSLKTYDEASYISSTGSVEPSVDLEYAKSEMGAKSLTGHNEAYIAQELEGIYGVKNLIPYPYYDTSKTINGLTFTDNGDGSVTINGTCTEQTFYQFWGGRNNLITTYFLTENENYIMTLDVDGDINLSSGDCVLSLRTYPQNSTTPYQDVFYITKVTNNIRKQFTFTQPDGYIYSLLWLEFRTGAVLNNVTFKPMLRLASIQSDEYQPYAMSNYELTKKIKELETALTELTSQ